MSKNSTADGGGNDSGNTAENHTFSVRPPDTLESVTALARFEFEPGKNKDGTKILMVEWEDNDRNRSSEGQWQVSWLGKTTVLPADERPADNVRRFYFLLLPGTSIPPHVTLTYQPPKTVSPSARTALTLTINPLPAIFSPELGVTARASGKKGVLHTVWAKKRLQVLEQEIRREQEFNLEGIALEMALSEKEWIETNFGVVPPRIHAIDTSSAQKLPASPLSAGLASPKTPRSPGGRRLNEKLKGLNIATSEKDLAAWPKGSSNLSFCLLPVGAKTNLLQ